jgi:hypothetical protein
VGLRFLFLLALMPALAVSVRAATLRVPEDYASVLAAVDAAAAGDSVLVGPGTWTQTATRIVSVNGQSIPLTACAFLEAGITVMGIGGSAVTALQPAVGHGVVHTVSGSAPTVVEGFAMTGAVAVVASQNSPLEVKNCWLLENATAAVDVSLSGHVILRDCRIEGNTWNQVGSGYAVAAQSSTVEFYDCEFRDNHGLRAVRVDIGSRAVVDGCTVSGHVWGGALLFESVPDLQIRNSTFTANRNTGNGGAITAVSCSGVVEFCVFNDDSAFAGGGISVQGGAVALRNNTFHGCSAVLGSAISIGGSDPGVHNNIIAYSTGQYGAVDRTSGLNAVATGCNVFWANEPPDFSSFGTWTASPTDIFSDPQFCAPGSDDFTLHSGSPGAPGVTPACGTIGALGVGCGSVSIESTSWGRIKGQYR